MTIYEKWIHFEDDLKFKRSLKDYTDKLAETISSEISMSPDKEIDDIIKKIKQDHLNRTLKFFD
jgi:hypothetical protein